MQGLRFFVLGLLLSSACGGTSSALGLGSPSDSGAPPSTPGSADGGAGPAAYEVHLRATQTPVSFSDSFTGETPIDQRLGIRSLTLLRSAGDTAPVVVFDHGGDAVDAPVNDGSDTLVGTAAPGALAAGTFTIAKVGVGYYDFRVAATMHAGGLATAGDYHDVEVLGDHTSYHGQIFDKGYYSFTFEVGGTAYGTVTGTDLVTPVDLATGGLTLVASGNDATYVFAVNVTIDPSPGKTGKVLMLVNTFEDFRWQDQNQPGYTAGLFDTTPTSYEPVESFGASSFSLTVE